MISFQDGTKSRIVTDLRVVTVIEPDAGTSKQAAE
jgi:hypothetical protein